MVKTEPPLDIGLVASGKGRTPLVVGLAYAEILWRLAMSAEPPRRLTMSLEFITGVWWLEI